MQQADERAAEKEIKSAERDQSRRIVKHATGRILQEAALLEKAIFHQIAQAVAPRQLLENIFERTAPFQRRCIRFRQNWLQNFRHVLQTDFATAEFWRCAK